MKQILALPLAVLDGLYNLVYGILVVGGFLLVVLGTLVFVIPLALVDKIFPAPKTASF